MRTGVTTTCITTLSKGHNSKSPSCSCAIMEYLMIAQGRQGRSPVCGPLTSSTRPPEEIRKALSVVAVPLTPLWLASCHFLPATRPPRLQQPLRYKWFLAWSRSSATAANAGTVPCRISRNPLSLSRPLSPSAPPLPSVSPPFIDSASLYSPSSFRSTLWSVTGPPRTRVP